MKLRLDDNTRSALHFLLLAVGVLGAFRLAYVGFVHGTRAEGPDAVALEPWRHGYLLPDPYAVARASTTLPERMAWIFLYAIAIGFTAFLLATLIARLSREVDSRHPIILARVAGTLVLVLGLVSALRWPPQAAWPDVGTRTWRVVQRVAVPGDLTLPWPVMERGIPFTEVPVLQIDQSIPGALTIEAGGATNRVVLGTLPHAVDTTGDDALVRAALEVLRTRSAAP